MSVTPEQGDWLIQTNWHALGPAIPKLKDRLATFPGFIHLDLISADFLIADEFLAAVTETSKKQLIESSLSSHELILSIDQHPAFSPMVIHQLTKIFFPLGHQGEGRWILKHIDERTKLKPEHNVVMVFTFADDVGTVMVAVSIFSMLSQRLKQVSAA